MLRAKEHAPTPFPFVVFIFGFAVGSIKELGSASNVIWKAQMNCKSKLTIWL
jgi:hypothetical protein